VNASTPSRNNTTLVKRALVLVFAVVAGCCSEAPAATALPAARVQSEPYVLVLGQVERPGRYQLVAPTTLMTILAAAKLTPLAWQPTITRTAWDGRKVKARMSLSRIESGESPDVWLFPGDIVYVDERTF
jgi:hypothetical protein